MSDPRALAEAFGRLANDHSREAVLAAAATILLNVLRQMHPASRDDATEHLCELAGRMCGDLHRHYAPDGGPKRVVMPPMGKLFPQLDGLSGELLDRFVQGRSLRG